MSSEEYIHAQISEEEQSFEEEIYDKQYNNTIRKFYFNLLATTEETNLLLHGRRLSQQLWCDLFSQVDATNITWYFSRQSTISPYGFDDANQACVNELGEPITILHLHTGSHTGIY